MPIQLSDIYRVRKNIYEIACRTPLVPAWSLSDRNRDVQLKLEIAQPTGALKVDSPEFPLGISHWSFP